MEARDELYQTLGQLPDRHRPIRSSVRAVTRQDGLVREDLLLDLNGEEPVRGWLVRPEGVTGRLPVILYNHSHAGEYAIGRDEIFVGKRCIFETPYAQDLCRQGWAVLTIDHWCFGHRRQDEFDLVKTLLWRGSTLWGMMVYDSLRCLDYLAQRPDIDASRIATMGTSLGSNMAWWVSALDTRIKVCVDILCLTDYQALIAANNLGQHSFYYYLPGLLRSWTSARINALIAPRPHLGIAGTFDRLTPVDGLDRIEAELDRVYAEVRAPSGSWRMERHASGHKENALMRAQAIAFLRQWL